MTDETTQAYAEDSSPRHKHLRKLAAEAEALKKAKENTSPQRIEIEVVHDSRGRAKYRKVSYMPNGNKYRVYISDKAVQQLKAQDVKLKK